MMRSSRRSDGTAGTRNFPRFSKVARGVPGTTVTVSAEKNSGSIRVMSAAVARACSSARSPPIPRSTITLMAIPAA
ncbi:MAG: hypothetical protein RMJ98_00465 [Myxococcales bacterium]|nr:hypothetical protein [Polyangiaceae bacterium]MDW8247759.1 hypothetical protein [Myxococcales bacterium]